MARKAKSKKRTSGRQFEVLVENLGPKLHQKGAVISQADDPALFDNIDWLIETGKVRLIEPLRAI